MKLRILNKLRTLLILVLSLFIFSSCGIPSINNFEISLNSQNDGDFNIVFDMSIPAFSDLLSDASSSSSPGLLLLYTVSSKTNIPYNNMIYLFNTNYRGTTYQGRNFSFGSVNRICDYNLSSSNSYTDKATTIGLYPLNYIGYDDSYNIKAPAYTYSLKSIVDGSTIYVNNNVDNGVIEYSYNKTNSTEDNTLIGSMVRYNGEPFVTYTQMSGSGNLTSNPDYYDWAQGMDSDSLTNTYVHLFAAINVTPGTSAMFSNIYWTNLVYIGYVEIT